MANIATKLQDDDLFGRKFGAAGSNFSVGGRPAYRFQWTKESTSRGGVEYIFFNEGNFFFEVTAECAVSDVDRCIPLMDEMMTKATFK